MTRTRNKLILFFTTVTSFASGAAAASGSVESFALQPHATTAIPAANGDFKAEILEARIKNQDVIRLTRKPTPHPVSAQLVGVDLARGAGLAAIAWTVQLPDGRRYNLTGADSAADIESRYEKDSANAYRDNLFFQKGVVASLYPLTNRLTGSSAGAAAETVKDAKVLSTTVAGAKVTMPLNNIASIKNAIPHHLHGLLFGQLAATPHDEPMVKVTAQSARASGEFEVAPPWWTGRTRITTSSELSAQRYSYRMKVKNIGSTPVPVGAGAHPYFMSPDANPDSIRVHVPAQSTADINNLSDVLPTGHITALKDADPALDFSDAHGTLLFARSIKNNATTSRLDNLWVDLDKNVEGFAYVEVFFPLSRFKVRMTALTKNVVGIQGYAPQPTPGQNPFVALELVTNLPDPREELWGKRSTGMTVLKPGETFEYGYRIELMPL